MPETEKAVKLKDVLDEFKKQMHENEIDTTV
jgi:hypothetical protein